MEEDIAYWKGTRVKDMSREELQSALVECYRDYERVQYDLFKLSGGTGQKSGASNNMRFVKSRIAA